MNDKGERDCREDELQRLSAQLLDVQREKDQFKQRSEAAEARAHIIEQALTLSPSRPTAVTLGEASLSSESSLGGMSPFLARTKYTHKKTS